MPEGGPSAKWKPLRNNGSVHAGMTAPFRFADGMLSGGQRRRSSKNKPSIVREREWETSAFPWIEYHDIPRGPRCLHVLFLLDHPRPRFLCTRFPCKRSLVFFYFYYSFIFGILSLSLSLSLLTLCISYRKIYPQKQNSVCRISHKM